jgi:hypothetical protein
LLPLTNHCHHQVFRTLRFVFGYRLLSFARSVGSKPLVGVGGGGGRSGASFYTTYDKRYIVKSVPSQELVVLLEVLKDYVEHMITNAKHTLLPRFLGLHKVGGDWMT